MTATETRPPAAVLEPARIAALHGTTLLDSPVEQSFDRLTRLATRLLGAPVALVSLVDHDRQFFKSQCGLPEPLAAERQTPLSHSFCQHAVALGQPLVIEDAREHPLVHDNLAVTELGVIAYLGIPLATRSGQVLGSFCVIQGEPRRWTDEEIETMRELATSVMTEVELRMELVERRAAERALRQSERRFRTFFEQSAIGIGLLSLDGWPLAVNAALAASLGHDTDALRDLPFATHLLPSPGEPAVELQELARVRSGPLRTEAQMVRADGSAFWARVTASRVEDLDGRPLYLVVMVEDISDRKRAEALAEELRILEGLLPICIFCKDIRNEGGEWERLEAYIAQRTPAEFSHGYCPRCTRHHYGDLAD